MSARDEILGRLRSRAHTVDLPPPWESRNAFPDLAAQFTRALVAGAGEVHHAANKNMAVAQLKTILKELGAHRVVSNALPIPTADIQDPSYELLVVGGSDAVTESELRTYCETADVGVSGADAALAETGSVVISSAADQSRLATLLPPVHIAMVPASCLTTDIFTWTAVRGQAEGSPFESANFTLVSGPSKTADIEQVLAIGVHGPRRFIVILYDD